MSDEINLLLKAIEAGSLSISQAIEQVIDMNKKDNSCLANIRQQLDQRIDINFNFDDVPEINVSPPDTSEKPAGVQVESINDSEFRSAYQKLICANQEKIERYNKQVRLRNFQSALLKLT